MKDRIKSIPLLLLIIIFILPACAPAIVQVLPNPTAYILVTAPAAATPTPFQPGNNSLPTLTLPPPPTFTPIPPSATPIPPTATPIPPSPTAVMPTLPPVQPSAIPTAIGIRPQYAITAMLDYDAHTLTVSQDIYYPNNTGQTLSSLLLAVNPNLWSGVFALQSLAVNDNPHNDYSLAGHALTINLPNALGPGDTVKIGISYLLNLPYASSKFENFGYSSRQTNLTDWFPFIVPYINGQWILREPWAFGENLVYDKADFHIELGFASPDNIPVVAASAPAQATDAGLRYTLTDARTFSFSMSREFAVSAQTTASGVTVTSYYYPEDADAGNAVLARTAEAVETYSRVIGPYTHSALSVVETDLNDGLESDGLYFLARSFYRSYDGTATNNLTVIGIHETAHQWWFGSVASDQAEEPWLDEALSCYTEHIYYENNYPNLVNWWWNWRVNYYNPTGYIDTRIYNPPTFRAYVNAVYLNGANFFDALRIRIGDQAFFNFLRDYYASNTGRIANANDFFAALARHASGYDDITRAYFQNR